MAVEPSFLFLNTDDRLGRRDDFLLIGACHIRMLPRKEVLISFSDDFRLILESSPGQHGTICRHKTALAIFKVNVVREVIHQHGQAISLADLRGVYALRPSDVRAKLCSGGFSEARRYFSNGCWSDLHQFSEFVFFVLPEVRQKIMVEWALRSGRAPLQSGAKFCTPQRLTYIVVHARDETFLTITDHGAGGHRDNPPADTSSFPLADFLCDLIPVHVR